MPDSPPPTMITSKYSCVIARISSAWDEGAVPAFHHHILGDRRKLGLRLGNALGHAGDERGGTLRGADEHHVALAFDQFQVGAGELCRQRLAVRCRV